MPVYDANNKLLGITYMGRMWYPRYGWATVTYVTYLAEGYFDEKTFK